jgi:hypothetical protein
MEDDCCKALDALLRALITHREALVLREPGKLVVTTISGPGDLKNLPTRAECRIRDFTKDPVGVSLRLSIRHVGERLFAKSGSTKQMREVIDRAAEIDPPRAVYRGVILDHACHGIGISPDIWSC